MKNSTFVKLGIAIVLMYSANHVAGQSSTANNIPGGGKFLGYNAGGTGGDIDFRTNNVNRMRLMQSGNSTINGYNVNRSGFLGLSQEPAFFTSGVQSPYSLLHLNGNNGGNNPQQLGYRDWMRYGIVFTHNRDLMYVGPRSNGTDITDAVIAWADNPAGPGLGPDVLRFLFTSGTTDEVEIARMTGEGMRA